MSAGRQVTFLYFVIHKLYNMASEDAARLKNMRIKTGVLKRIAKEKEYYIKESEKEREKLEKMKADETKDEYDVRKQNEVLSESLMMVPDCELKLKNAYAELVQLTEKDNDLSQAEEYKAAVAMIGETKEKVQAS